MSLVRPHHLVYHPVRHPAAQRVAALNGVFEPSLELIFSRAYTTILRNSWAGLGVVYREVSDDRVLRILLN